MWKIQITALTLMLALSGCEQPAMERNRELTSAVLQRTGAPDFVDASTPANAAVRHMPSGLVCFLPYEGTFEMGVFPAEAPNPGAHCAVARGQEAAALIVVRFGEGSSLEQVFADAVRTTLNGQETRRWPGRASDADQAEAAGLPNFRIGRFQIMINGAPTYVRVAASEQRGWYLQQIVTAPATQGEAAEARAGADWRAALEAFAAAE